MKKYFLMRVYLLGYSNDPVPRWIRALLARTELHRAWISGRRFVHFDENGKRLTGFTMPEEQAFYL